MQKHTDKLYSKSAHVRPGATHKVHQADPADAGLPHRKVHELLRRLYSLRSVLNLDIPLWDFIGKEVLERSQGNIQGDIITHSSRQRCFGGLAGTPDNGENYKGGDKGMGTLWGEINS